MTVQDQSVTVGGAGGSGQEPFTPALQSFFKGVADWPWEVYFPSALFIRDYHDLPVSSPHDIDLMMDADLQSSFLSLVAQMAEEANLYCFRRNTLNACFVILFDLNVSSKGRAWAYLEVRDQIRLAPGLVLRAADIETETHQACGLRVPNAPWTAFLEIFQGVRTGKIGKAERVLDVAGLDLNTAHDLFHSLLGLDLRFSEPLSKCSRELQQIARTIDVKPPKPAQPSELPLRTRINRALFRNIYALHNAKPLFFTINGPDGVGKTTTCAEVEKIFARLPLPFSSFHHITGWKYDMKAAQREAAEKTPIRGSKECRPGPLHLVMRWVYRRLLPESIQRAYVLAQGYDMYLRKLNALIYSGYCRDHIMFVDRYIYDMATKNIIQGNGQGWMHRIFIRLARPPMRAFILTDNAEAIRKRKQELTLKQIESYQQIMGQLISDRDVTLEQIDVGGRSPQTIARTICRKILDDCDFALMVLLREGTKNTGEKHG